MARRLTLVEPPDQVTRFEQLKGEYPEASYSCDGGFFYGSLRSGDLVMRNRSSLKGLIDGLLQREQGDAADATGSLALCCDA